MEVELDGIFLQNSTYNYDDYEYKGEDCFPEEGINFTSVFLPLLYSLTMVFGLLGNGLVFWILAQKRRGWTVTDTFILHLGVSDSLLLLTLPFWASQAAQAKGWSFGTPLCKITGAIFQINFYCGIFLLAVISLDRYLCIVHAVQMYSRKKSWVVHVSCLSVWLFSLLLSIPDWIFLEAVEDSRWNKIKCVHNYLAYFQSVADWRLASRLIYHTVGFLLPSAVLLFCYSCILLRLQRGSQGLQKHRAIRVILALVLVFFLCWTPYNITLMVDTFKGKHIDPEKGSCEERRTETGLVVTSALGCLHACLNPLLYFWLCGNFRRVVLRLLMKQKGTQNNLSLWDLSGPEESTPKQVEEIEALNQISLGQAQTLPNPVLS